MFEVLAGLIVVCYAVGIAGIYVLWTSANPMLQDLSTLVKVGLTLLMLPVLGVVPGVVGTFVLLRRNPPSPTVV